jgi:hypothetical protein
MGSLLILILEFPARLDARRFAQRGAGYVGAGVLDGFGADADSGGDGVG